MVSVTTPSEILRQQVACLRILRALAEQECDDAQADAAAYRSERDAVNQENRRLRLKANEDDAFLRAARHIGQQTERELEDLRSRIDVYQCEVEGLKAQLAKSQSSGPSSWPHNSLPAAVARIRARNNA